MNRIALLIAEKSQQLAIQLIPKIVDMARKLAIEKIGTPLENMINSCPFQTELQKLLELRNELVNKLNTTANTINSLSKTLDPLTTTIDTSEKALQTAKTARTVASAAVAFIPSPPGTPGIVISTINNLKNIEDFLTPIITISKNTVSSIENSLDFTNNTILQIIKFLNSIDSKLKFCGVDPQSLTPYNDYITTLLNTKEDVPQNNIYKGFVLEIEIKPYSPTVNRRRAVAKNNNNIILLSTPYSFTTLDQVLINELKLIIDANNLKAD